MYRVPLSLQAVGVAQSNKAILVACMNDAVHCYKGKGQKAYSLYMPAAIQAMALLNVVSARSTRCLLLSLVTGAPCVWQHARWHSSWLAGLACAVIQ